MGKEKNLTFLLLFKKKNTVIRYACIILNARSYSLIILNNLKKFQKIFGLFLNSLFIRTCEFLNSIYIISSKIVRKVTFIKKIEFKVNFKQNETQIYTVNFKIIKFDLFVYFIIFFINSSNTNFLFLSRP